MSSEDAFPRSDRSWARQKRLQPYLLIGPAVVVVLAVVGYPVIHGTLTSLRETDLFTDGRPFTGLENYVRLVTDAFFHNAFLTTFAVMFGTVTLGLLLSFGVAVYLDQAMLGKKVLRMLALVPFFVSSTVLGTIWRFLFATDGGAINAALSIAGVEPVSWLGVGHRALGAVTIANIWSVAPLASLIILGGLLMVDPQMKEAAAIDGASSLQILRHVTLPTIRPQIALALVWLSFASFNAFGVILPMTGGGPGRSTEVMSLYMYNQAFRQFDYGVASAVMVILLLLNILFSVFYLRLGGGGFLDSKDEFTRAGAPS